MNDAKASSQPRTARRPWAGLVFLTLCASGAFLFGWASASTMGAAGMAGVFAVLYLFLVGVAVGIAVVMAVVISLAERAPGVPKTRGTRWALAAAVAFAIGGAVGVGVYRVLAALGLAQ